MSMTAELQKKPIKLMLVDDSIIIRTLLARILKGAADIEIVASAANGMEALENAPRFMPDVILLDLEMPVMDGLTAIPLLRERLPDVKIILCSALSEKGADITLKGLSLGAADFILKPSALTGAENKDIFRTTLLDRIYHISNQNRKDAPTTHKEKPRHIFELRSGLESIRRPAILAIGSSTGGPNALTEFFKNLRKLPIPIVITQHMPRTFTKILADQLSKAGSIPCYEGEDGMMLKPGCAYVAPGDYHMIFRREKDSILIGLDSGPAENFCRPSVDPMLRSLHDIYKDKILTVIMTGMGSDGLEGCRQVTASGGHTFAQDEGSSAVWGMPGAVARAGLCSYVDTIPRLADRIQSIMDKSL